jgi:hypothetical protein
MEAMRRGFLASICSADTAYVGATRERKLYLTVYQ